MAKTEQELAELKQQIEQLREKLAGLSAEELEEVIGGKAMAMPDFHPNSPLPHPRWDDVRTEMNISY